MKTGKRFVPGIISGSGNFILVTKSALIAVVRKFLPSFVRLHVLGNLHDQYICQIINTRSTQMQM
jgi:hypothetical protein